MQKFDPTSGLAIEEVWPVSTVNHPNGGIGVYWSGNIGFGEFVLFWGEDDKLHARTETLDNPQHKDFTKAILDLLVEQIIIDE